MRLALALLFFALPARASLYCESELPIAMDGKFTSRKLKIDRAEPFTLQIGPNLKRPWATLHFEENVYFQAHPEAYDKSIELRFEALDEGRFRVSVLLKASKKEIQMRCAYGAARR
jgi:hypothetical protein